MRLNRNLFWIPSVLALLALTAAPLAAQETSEEKEKKNVEVKAEVVDGKVIITDGNGKVKVIELKDHDGPVVWHQHSDEEHGDKHKPRSENKFIVRQHQGHDVSQDEDGNLTVRSRAILVGPDGKAKEVTLDGIGDGEFNFQVVRGDTGELVQVMPGSGASDVMVQLSALSGEGFMIGVTCKPVGEAMKAQLGLKHGLVVESVVKESPSDGKIEEHDILVRIDGEDLGELSQLIEAIQDAGKNESEVKLHLLRSGKKVKVALTPKKRENNWIADLKNLDGENFKFSVGNDFEFGDGVMVESFGPGLIEVVGEADGGTEELQLQIEKLRLELEQLREKLNDKE